MIFLGWAQCAISSLQLARMFLAGYPRGMMYTVGTVAHPKIGVHESLILAIQLLWLLPLLRHSSSALTSFMHTLREFLGVFEEWRLMGTFGSQHSVFSTLFSASNGRCRARTGCVLFSRWQKPPKEQQALLLLFSSLCRAITDATSSLLYPLCAS